MEENSIVESKRHLSAAEGARPVFKKELKPIIDVAQKAEAFGRVLHEYESGLNSAVLEGKFGKDVRDASLDVMRMQSLKKSSKSSDAQESEDLAIRQNAKKVFSFFSEHFGGTASLLSSYLDGDSKQNEQLQELIGINLSHFISIRTGLGKPFREELQKKEIEEMGRFLLTNSSQLSDLRKGVTPQDNIGLLEQLDNVRTSLQVEKDMLELSDPVKAFALRDWIRTTAKEARQGRRIYETPFYKNLLDELHFQSRKKNGVGGVILYGPPGTGKTEILQEKNKQQGFKTHVINIHHYTSFGDLIAEKAMQLDIDQGASMAQKLKAVLDVFGNESPDDFATDFKSLFSQLQREGKIGPQESISDFLSSFVSQGTIYKLDPNSMSLDDWGKIKAGFVTKQKSRILRTTLGAPYQETLEDIVKGEILLAIKNGQRVVLDELDKAGPNSLGGILSFLAKSPGETFEYGDSTFTIPSWFSVDATSNNTQLNEYLKDRFSGIEVSTPPIKDQLMIAGVRLSDDEGNILLTDYEQRQLVGFFAYKIPEINTILVSYNISPLSIRRIQELTSYLVDFRTLQRTGVTFGDAIQKLFERIKTSIVNKEAANAVDGVLKNSTDLLADKPSDFRKQAPRADSRLTREEMYSRAIRRITRSPLIVGINGLMSEDSNSTSGHNIATVVFNEKQCLAAKEWLIAKDSKKGVRADIRQLPIGLTIQEVVEGNLSSLKIMALPEDDSLHVLLTHNIPKLGKIAGVSEDGTVVIVGSDSPNDKDSEVINVFEISDSTKANAGQNIEARIEKDSEVGTDRKAKQMGVLDKRSNNLTIYRTDSLSASREIHSVKRFEISPNGKLLIKESLSGETEIILIDSLKPLALLSGDSWSFVGDRLIAQKSGQNSIEEKGFLIT